MSAYIIFRNNKRFPLTKGDLYKMVEERLIGSSGLKNIMGKPHIIEQTIGAQIGNHAEFKIDFFGTGHYGNVNVDA